MQTENEVFDLLNRMYVQRADERQKEMGLQYTEAETHDLAKQVVKFCITPIAKERDTLRDILKLLVPDLKAMADVALAMGNTARAQALNNICKGVEL